MHIKYAGRFLLEREMTLIQVLSLNHNISPHFACLLEIDNGSHVKDMQKNKIIIIIKIKYKNIKIK
jgi:hypothetical protein